MASIRRTVKRANQRIRGTKKADKIKLLRGADDANVTLGNGRDTLTATNVFGGNYNLGAGNDKASVIGGRDHFIDSGSGSDSLSIKNSTGDQIHLGSGANDKLTLSKVKNATLFHDRDDTGKKTITGANSNLKFDLQGAVYQQKVKGKDLILTVYNDDREVVATYIFKKCAPKSRRPKIVNGCKGFAATEEIHNEEYTPIGTADTTTLPTSAHEVNTVEPDTTASPTSAHEVNTVEPDTTTLPTSAHEVNVCNPEDWGCQQSYGTDPITDEVYTDLTGGSSQDFCGSPAIDPIISDEVYSWSYTSSDSLTTPTQNIAHETSVVQPPQQSYVPARETEVAQPVF